MDSGFLLTAGGTAVLSSVIIQWMKKSELAIFGFLGTDKNKQRVNLYFSIFVAFVTSIGIGFKYDGAVGVLVISGLTAAGIQHGLWHWFTQWIGQHISYKAIIVPQELQAANIDVLNQLLDQLKSQPRVIQVQPVAGVK
jgi:hypothetical protein